MAKVLIATDKPFNSEGVKKIRNVLEGANYDVLLCEKYTQKTQLIEAIKGIDAIIIRSDLIDKEIINAADKLKIVVRAGAGYDNVDLESASQRKIVVMNTPGQNANAVAELALGMMVSVARNNFNGSSGTELRGRKLGIHAYGNVGRYVAEIAKGFGMEVYAYDPFVPKDLMEKDGITYIDNAHDLYSTCQYISLHVPLVEKTRKSINYTLLSKMPKNAVLVNTARKEVINEDDMLRIYKESDDFRYISDIAPDCKDEIEKNFAGRFFFTPKKMGAQTTEANINAGVAAARQIINFLEKDDRTYQVNN